MTKVAGNISQLEVIGSMSQLKVSGNIVQGGAFNWTAYWSTRYPSELTATIISDTQIDLGWTNNGNVDYDGISIERSLDGITYAEIDTIVPGVAYSDITVTVDIEYSYRIRYYRGTHYSAYSNEVDITDADWTVYWAAYWAGQSEGLFFGEVSKITGGKLYNQKPGATDYLTVTGAAGSYTFQCPNTAPYIAADTDYIWFRADTTQRTAAESELIGYDFTRTIVKYGNVAPYTLEAIMIISSDLDTARMRNDFQLSIWWSDVLSDYGMTKDNRGAERSIWVPLSLEYYTVYSAFPTKPSAADTVIQKTMLDALVTLGVYAKAEFLDVFSAHANVESLYNWKNPLANNPILINAPAWTQYAGYTGNNAGGKAVDLNFTLSANTLLATQNDICVMIGVGDDLASAHSDFGVYRLTDRHTWINSRDATDKCRSALSGKAYLLTPNANGKKHISLSRNGAASYNLFLNKIKTSPAFASESFTNDTLIACGLNSNGTLVAGDRTLRYVFLFSYLSDAEINGVIDIMEAYLDNYGTGLI